MLRVLNARSHALSSRLLGQSTRRTLASDDAIFSRFERAKLVPVVALDDPAAAEPVARARQHQHTEATQHGAARGA